MYKIPAKTLFLGKNLTFVPECHSTNDLALQLCQKKEWFEGTLVITHNQTAGRGQRGNTWIAEAGKNLTFSLLLKPTFLSGQEQFYLSVFVSLGIRDYVTEQTDQKVHIKWPNDILAGEKKIAGILIENQIAGNNLAGSVIGIGLNINQQHFGIDSPTSLSLLTGKGYNLSDELETLLQKLERRYLQLKERKFTVLMDDYLKALYRLNEGNQYSINDVQFEGTIIGVDEIGRLKMRIGNEVKVFDIKDIRYR